LQAEDIELSPWKPGLGQGMVEYWNVGLNKEVTHRLASLSRGILPIVHLVQDKFTHYSIIPIFQYSSWGEAPKFRV